MKRIIFLLFSPFIFLSCTNSTTSNSSTAEISYKENQIEENVHETNIKINVGEESNLPGTFNIEKDVQIENQILGNITFGISEKQYKNMEEKVLEEFEDEEEYGYHIGNFSFHSLQPYFHNNKLYRLDLIGFNKLDYSDIIKEVEDVKEIFSKKYGNPIFEGKLPKDKELSQNEGTVIAEWKAGNKTIQLAFYDFSKTAHSNLLKIVIFNSAELKQLIEEKTKKEEVYKNANVDKI